MQLWAKILGGSKLSLPYVFISSIEKKIRNCVHRWFKRVTQPSQYCSPSKSTADCESITAVSIKKHRQDIHYPERAEERLQNADDPSHGAKEKKHKQGKSRNVRLEVITVQSSSKVKVKSFGVASERLITEHIDISPVSSPEVRSASSSPKFSRRVNDPSSSKREPKRDFRNWVKDQVHLKFPSFKRSVSDERSHSRAGIRSPTVLTGPLEMNLSLPQVVVTPADPSALFSPGENPKHFPSSLTAQVSCSDSLKLKSKPPPPLPLFSSSKPMKD
jgi:hypothetical protein